LEYDLISNSIEVKSYWDIVNFYNKEKLDLSYDDAKKELEKILVDSFSLRMVSDVPVGTFLSGGIDSSLVTAILQKNSSKPINTFTIGFDDEKYNEAPYAKEIAKHLGTEHTEHYCSKQDAMDIIVQLPKMYDEPFGDSSAIPTILVSQIAKEKVSVVLSGDGADELFDGYTSYGLFDKRYKKIENIPLKNLLKETLKTIPDPIIKLQNYNEKYYLKYLKLKNSLEHRDIANMFKVSNSVFTKYEVEKALRGYYFYQSDKEYKGLHNLEKMMFSDFKGYLSDDILVKVDRASMSISLESREPLLDHKIIEFTSTLPIEYKQNKKVLKDILSDYVPKELFERKKRGFGIPINNWLRNELRYLIDKYLDSSLIQKQNIFDEQYIEDLKYLFFKGNNNDRKIWTILMFQMWHEENMEQ
jgi:asparagine synthase (glutamine-hydrolysing)